MRKTLKIFGCQFVQKSFIYGSPDKKITARTKSGGYENFD
jgi:hypothetical protein